MFSFGTLLFGDLKYEVKNLHCLTIQKVLCACGLDNIAASIVIGHGTCEHSF